jgi:mRNA degradation ribonuclease J1/J2
MRHANKKVAMSLGMPDDKILLPENGQIVEIYDEISFVSDKRIKLDTVMIDGK